MYSLIFQTVVPGVLLQFRLSKCPAGRQSPIDKLAEADRSSDWTRRTDCEIRGIQYTLILDPAKKILFGPELKRYIFMGTKLLLDTVLRNA